MPIPFRPPRHILMLSIGCATVLGGCALWAQTPQTQFTVQPGQPDAEMLAGPWVGDDPFSNPTAQLVIHLRLVANRRVPFHENRVTGDGPQRFQNFEIKFYQRVDGEWRFDFYNTVDPRSATWDGNRLTVTLRGLDLNFDKQGSFWTGTYTRGSVTKSVRLTRPGGFERLSNPFVGGWLESYRYADGGLALDTRCVHIAQNSNGALAAWRDIKDLHPSGPREGDDVATIREEDGEAMGVKTEGDTLILEEVNDGRGLHLPWIFTGKLSRDGTRITGSWVIDDGPDAIISTFTRLPQGQSCWSQPSGLQADSGKP